MIKQMYGDSICIIRYNLNEVFAECQSEEIQPSAG